MDDKDIIEVEVVSETTAKQSEPSKTEVLLSDHSVEIHRYAFLSNLFLNLGRSGIILFIILGFAFSILYSQASTTPYLVLMILGWSLAGLSLLEWVLGFIFHRLMLSHMSKDPSYVDANL